MGLNIVCTSKPCDGLFYYSYEYTQYLNHVGVKTDMIIVTHPRFTTEDYFNAIIQKYNSFENVIFNDFEEVGQTLIMGRSMLTLPYLNKKDYTKEQLLTLHFLFSNRLISVYSENHPIDYHKAVEYFKPKEIFDLCDYDVYPNGVGKKFEKIINFSIYKSFKHDIKYQYLFLGTNEIYYKEIEKVIGNNYMLYQSHGIITYPDRYLNPKYNNINVPVKNLLGSFETYVYTKPNFDPAPRIIQECKYFGKKVLYLRDKEIKDGGPVYWKRPANCLTDNVNENNFKQITNII